MEEIQEWLRGIGYYCTIDELTDMRTLYLDFNHLENISDSIGMLSNLQDLWLCSNKIRELPGSIGDLSNLRQLWLQHNQIQQLPDSIARLRNLRVLCLYDNQISKIPLAIRKLKALKFSLEHVYPHSRVQDIIHIIPLIESKNIVTLLQPIQELL